MNKCPICYNNQSWHKICSVCGYKFDKASKSFAEEYYNLLIFWDYNKNKINPNYIVSKSNKKIWLKCRANHSWKSSLNNFINGHECPYCSGCKVLKGFNDLWTTNPDLCKELVDQEDGYKYSKGSHKKVKWKCIKCNNIWKSSIATRAGKQNCGCPKCNSSKGENKICEILDQYNIKYEKEKTFDGCKYKQKLRFDFYIPDYNTCIEYQGIQHYPEKYKKSNFNINSSAVFGYRHDKKDMDNIQKRDKIKRQFCIDNNINLIEIPYWNKSKIELYIKQIIGI